MVGRNRLISEEGPDLSGASCAMEEHTRVSSLQSVLTAIFKRLKKTVGVFR
jgi:hypothetical protein